MIECSFSIILYYLFFVNCFFSIAGIITKALEPLGIIPVVVGGAAVEFYTLGQYATMDIDFVGIIDDEMKEVMAEFGRYHKQYPIINNY